MMNKTIKLNTTNLLSEIETHPFKPFIPTNATILIIGSFPGRDIIRKKFRKR